MKNIKSISEDGIKFDLEWLDHMNDENTGVYIGRQNTNCPVILISYNSNRPPKTMLKLELQEKKDIV